MKVREQLRALWRQAIGGTSVAVDAADASAERKTLALPAILSPVQFPGQSLPKPTPVNLRRFAETPVVRRAINVIKDRVAAMDWQVRRPTRMRRGEDAVPQDAQETSHRLAGLAAHARRAELPSTAFAH